MSCLCCSEHVVKPYNCMFLQDHRTPLHWAARSYHTDIVKILIEKGADVNAKDDVS